MVRRKLFTKKGKPIYRRSEPSFKFEQRDPNTNAVQLSYLKTVLKEDYERILGVGKFVYRCVDKKLKRSCDTRDSVMNLIEELTDNPDMKYVNNLKTRDITVWFDGKLQSFYIQKKAN